MLRLSFEQAGFDVIPAQCRAARALLGLSQKDLATRSGVSTRAVAAFELGETTPTYTTLCKLQQVLISAGVRFTHEDERIGVYLHHPITDSRSY
ncbi:MAG: multiprotein-bridging factor 1 family protein [Parvibaculaceae bacterium]